jgi:hypothetical protein
MYKMIWRVIARKGHAHNRYIGDVEANIPEQAFDNAIEEYWNQLEITPGEITEFHVQNVDKNRTPIILCCGFSNCYRMDIDRKPTQTSNI